MATNNLTPEQDLLTREFFEQVAIRDEFLPNDPAIKRSVVAGLLTALNYDWLPNGHFIEKGANLQYRFGSSSPDYDAYDDEWEDDKRRAEDAIANYTEDTPPTRTSKSTESAKVREAILSEDLF